MSWYNYRNRFKGSGRLRGTSQILHWLESDRKTQPPRLETRPCSGQNHMSIRAGSTTNATGDWPGEDRVDHPSRDSAELVVHSRRRERGNFRRIELAANHVQLLCAEQRFRILYLLYPPQGPRNEGWSCGQDHQSCLTSYHIAQQMEPEDEPSD